MGSITKTCPCNIQRFFKLKIATEKKKDFFNSFAQNIDCGYTLEQPHQGGSNEYPQSMFWIKNKKNRYTRVKPQYYYMKVGLKGVFIARICFPDVSVRRRTQRMLGSACPCTKFPTVLANTRKRLLCRDMTENVLHARIQRGGGGGGRESGPPWNLKILPKKKVISGFLGSWTPLVCDQKLPFSLDPLS